MEFFLSAKQMLVFNKRREGIQDFFILSLIIQFTLYLIQLINLPNHVQAFLFEC